MQLKTTLYDIIGYIIPGLLLAVLINLGFASYTHNLNLLCTLWSKIHSLTWIEIICILGLAYLIGHIISSASSLIIEKWICRNHDNKTFLDGELLKAYEKKLEDLYSLRPNSTSFRLIICHVESKHPQVYSTAFVFQSFYGMARNISFLLFLFALWEIIVLIRNIFTQAWQPALISLLWTLGTLLLGSFLFYIYKRFIRYYRMHIICGFLLKED